MLKTTVVGSYPVPEWLKTSPSEATLTDALTVVLRAQESPGIDVISDGELGRGDLERNAPGGMVERFVRPMEGIQTRFSRQQRDAHRARSETAYRPELLPLRQSGQGSNVGTRTTEG
jgi:5-methyltetrahydropteroyltriglutamate--homocysteine methyltransferase